MKALVIDHPGSACDWRLSDLPEPQPLPGEVLVRVHAVGLNPADYKIAEWGNPAWKYPHVMGLDVAGTIAAIGEGVSGWQIGDAVYYHGDFTRRGGFAEYATIPAHTIAPMPKTLSFAEAASVPCSGFAAYQGLFHKLTLKPGSNVLIEGGAGGVGSYAIQLAAHARTRVLTTTSARNRDYVRSLGAHDVIDYQAEDVAARVMALTGGRGVDVILNAVSQATTTADLELLAFGGHLVCVDSLPDLSKVRPFAKALSIHEIALGVAYLSGDRRAQEELAQIGRELGALLDAGSVRSALSRIIGLADVPDAFDEMAGRHVRGKMVALLVEN
ncbi:MAG: zinc-binding dehydrogenase [Anaerolineae bacterium]|nr:zinc-binding dehydrogenase [Anaerolineae bacterium]